MVLHGLHEVVFMRTLWCAAGAAAAHLGIMLQGSHDYPAVLKSLVKVS